MIRDMNVCSIPFILQVLASLSAAERPRLSDFVQEWGSASFQSALALEAGTTLLVTPPRNEDATSNGGGSAGGSNRENADRSVWIHAHLQTVALPNSILIYVLHWSRMSTDAYTVRRGRWNEADSAL